MSTKQPSDPDDDLFCSIHLPPSQSLHPTPEPPSPPTTLSNAIPFPLLMQVSDHYLSHLEWEKSDALPNKIVQLFTF